MGAPLSRHEELPIQRFGLFLIAFALDGERNPCVVLVARKNMSSLSISSTSVNPYYLLSQTASQTSQTGTAADSAGAAPAPLQGHHRHQHGGIGGGNAIAELLNSIATALNSADPSADPNQIIQDTIAKLLAGDGTGNTSSADSDGDNDGTATASTNAAKGQSFLDALQAHGVSLQQFETDLLTAVKNAQNGKVNAGTALKSFAPGSVLNATA